VLREAKNVHVVETRGLFVRRYTVVVGRKPINLVFKRADYETMLAEQPHDPVPFMRFDGRQYWWFSGAFWWEDDGLDAEDVRALVLERQRRKYRQLENAHVAMTVETAQRTGLARAPMSWVRRERGPEAVEPGRFYELRSMLGPDRGVLFAISEREFGELGRSAAEQPVLLRPDMNLWCFRGEFFTSERAVEARDVAVFARRRAPEPRRPGISEAVQRAVYERDGGACVKCGSRFNLQYDHVIPFSRGGASTVENLQLLCSECNRTKGAGFG
jgi:hypothetical protein